MAPRDLGIYPEVQTRPDVALDERPDLSKPTPEALIWVLEHWDQSPVAHLNFDFRKPFPDPECNTAGCAFGTAMSVWGENHYEPAVRVSDKTACFLVGQCDPRVTAVVVAGRMRDALAGRTVRYLTEGDGGYLGALRSAAHAVPE